MRSKGDGGGVKERKTLTQSHVQNLLSLLNTSWDKEAGLLRRTIIVLFGKTSSMYDSMFCFAIAMSR